MIDPVVRGPAFVRTGRPATGALPDDLPALHVVGRRAVRLLRPRAD